MLASKQLSFADIQERTCDVVSTALAIPRERVQPGYSLVEDLGADSLDLIELVMTLEETFQVTLPEDPPNAIYKTVFTRHPFRLSDLAELVYLQQGSGTPVRRGWRRAIANPLSTHALPFTQLGGVWQRDQRGSQSLLERVRTDGAVPHYRRRSDGMRCVLLPAATVEIGCPAPESDPDARPRHSVSIDAFLIDAEPVSTTAYCRFLNSVKGVYRATLQEWFLLDPEDDRNAHALVFYTAAGWQPVRGTEQWPMILVSWYGANAYSLWANNKDWQNYRDDRDATEGSYLPTEAQWEYAARGAWSQAFPWGNQPANHELAHFGQHQRSASYCADTLPLVAVHEPLGLSPFGLHHMAGNVWQWCRDWYHPAFYQTEAARAPNPVNRQPTGIRSERGGSWVGPAHLCRSSHRRGRPPLVRGRCLGFRCVSSLSDAQRCSPC